ncbi:hypothetical protein [Streptomyces sp. RG80]|uniref:hypothetical protein n=1 Tax=Streptomyces sp. RG80 TaxID=3157340 RepID=UPI00338ED12F
MKSRIGMRPAVSNRLGDQAQHGAEVRYPQPRALGVRAVRHLRHDQLRHRAAGERHPAGVPLRDDAVEVWQARVLRLVAVRDRRVSQPYDGRQIGVAGVRQQPHLGLQAQVGGRHLQVEQRSAHREMLRAARRIGPRERPLRRDPHLK